MYFMALWYILGHLAYFYRFGMLYVGTKKYLATLPQGIIKAT
jgi:hypothetical protein